MVSQGLSTFLMGARSADGEWMGERFMPRTTAEDGPRSDKLGQGSRIILPDGCFGSPIRAVRLCDTQIWLPDSAALISLRRCVSHISRSATLSPLASCTVLTILFFILRTGTITNSRSRCNRPMGRRRTRTGRGLYCHGASTRPTGVM